jgi:hypothetical protein
MMVICSWCGKECEEDARLRFEAGAFTWGDGDVEVEVVPGYEASFCCDGCMWAFELDKHRLIGMSAKEAREHLMEVHEICPGKAAGGQSRECFHQSAEMAKVMYKIMTGKGPSGPESEN